MMKCPECGDEAWRDEVDVGVGIIYGPYGCPCGWSEQEEYRHHPDPRIDSRGGFTPGGARCAHCGREHNYDDSVMCPECEGTLCKADCNNRGTCMDYLRQHGRASDRE